jgi:hypothetical protein
MKHEGEKDQEEVLKLHRLLERRAAPPEAPWLASRIIEATAQSVPKKCASYGSGIAELLAEIIPRPAYALASALLLGFLCGYAIPPQAPGPVPSSLQSTMNSMVQDFLVVDEMML